MSANINRFSQKSNNLPQKDGKLDFKAIFALAVKGMEMEAHNSIPNSNPDLSKAVFGELPPQALEIEEAVLGALLIDASAIEKVMSVFGASNPFYTDANQAVWAAIHNLFVKKEGIDRLLVFEEMSKLNKLSAIGGNPYYLIQLTEGVSSSANVEYHARLLLQKYIRRCMIQHSLDIVQKMYSGQSDELNVLGNSLQYLNNLQLTTLGKNQIMQRQSGIDIMGMALQAEDSRRIIGDFLSEGGITLMFAPAKVGKSIASVMYGVNVASGQSTLKVLVNECGPKKVLYFDFELSARDWRKRYLDEITGMPYDFGQISDTFIRFSERVEFVDYKNFSSLILREILMVVEQEKPSVIILDNITYLTDGSLDPSLAANIMKELKGINKRFNTSILVLAHVPKQYGKPVPITVDTMAGSAQLKNFATDIVGIGKSGKGKGHVYFIHLASRSRDVEFGSEKTLHCQIQKHGDFLGMDFIDFCEESEHLQSFDEAEEEQDMLAEAAKLMDTMSLRDIVKQLKLPFKKDTLKRKIDKYKKDQRDIDEFASAPQESECDDGENNVEIFEMPEFDRGADNEAFDSLDSFKEKIQVYFQAVTKLSNMKHLELQFHESPDPTKKKDINSLAYVYFGTNVVHINSFNWQFILHMDENAAIKGEYKHEILKIRQRGIRGQFAMLWLLCHEIMHLVEPKLKHGKIFFDRVEKFYNKCLVELRPF